MLLPPGFFKGVADGCPCNAPRGINHGLVPTNICTCKECDPKETGAVRYYTTFSPLRDALNALLVKDVPRRLIPDDVFNTNTMTEQDASDLLDFCVKNCKPSWATGYSIIESAEAIVREAVENGNIAPPKVS